MRNLALLIMLFVFVACAEQPDSEVSQKSQDLACYPACDDGNTSSLDTSDPNAAPAVDALWSTYTQQALSCDAYSGAGAHGGWIGCVICAGQIFDGCGYHGGGCYNYCRVCIGDTSPSDNMCGLASVMR